MFRLHCLIQIQCIGQELDQLEPVIFAASASSKVKDPKQKLTLTVRFHISLLWFIAIAGH